MEKFDLNEKTPTTASEEWKDVPGFEGLYQVSDLGQVKSGWRSKVILKPRLRGNGYPAVLLFNGLSKKGTSIAVHQLVAMAFLDHKRNGHKIVVDHIDLDKLNNRLDNLQLLTNRENVTRNPKNKYAGVSYCKRENKYVARTNHNKKRIWLGYFNTEIEAHIAYQTKIAELEKLKTP